MVNTLLIIRHSERIDESKVKEEKASWKVMVASDTTRRSKADLHDDPILTKRGSALAAEAATSLRMILNKHKLVSSGASSTNCIAGSVRLLKSDSGVNRIYTSRLRRCVETAYQMAIILQLPLYICTGLALTALAVERRKGMFQFHTLEEIKSFCPGVRVVSCDGDGDGDGDTGAAAIAPADDDNDDDAVDQEEATRSQPNVPDSSSNLCPAEGLEDVINHLRCDVDVSDLHLYQGTGTGVWKCESDSDTDVHQSSEQSVRVPTDNWLNALTTIAERHPYAIIVAHRESIRNLTADVGLPGYCHTAVFHHSLHDTLGESKLDAKVQFTKSRHDDAKTSRSPNQFVFQHMLNEKGKRVPS